MSNNVKHTCKHHNTRYGGTCPCRCGIKSEWQRLWKGKCYS